MGATVKIERTFGPLTDLELVTADDMRELGLLARERIVRRTLSGVDAEGSAFEPYSPGYAEAKAAALGSGPVNLQVSGAMLNDIQIVDVTAHTVTLGWLK